MQSISTFKAQLKQGETKTDTRMAKMLVNQQKKMSSGIEVRKLNSDGLKSKSTQGLKLKPIKSAGSALTAEAFKGRRGSKTNVKIGEMKEIIHLQAINEQASSQSDSELSVNSSLENEELGFEEVKISDREEEASPPEAELQ